MTTAQTMSRQAVPTSFIHEARREQLVASAVEVIAEVGVERASVVRISRHAGVSRGVFAYHFTDIDDLLDAVVASVYTLGGAQLHERVASAASPRDSVLAFVAGSVAFYAEYPAHIAALRAIFSARRRPGGARSASAAHRREGDDVETLLRAGQAAGQFRDFDPAVMFAMIRAVLDAAADRLTGIDPAEVDVLSAEVVVAVDGMTRSATSRKGTRR